MRHLIWHLLNFNHRIQTPPQCFPYISLHQKTGWKAITILAECICDVDNWSPFFKECNARYKVYFKIPVTFLVQSTLTDTFSLSLCAELSQESSLLLYDPSSFFYSQSSVVLHKSQASQNKYMLSNHLFRINHDDFEVNISRKYYW